MLGGNIAERYGKKSNRIVGGNKIDGGELRSGVSIFINTLWYLAPEFKEGELDKSAPKKEQEKLLKSRLTLRHGDQCAE